MREREYSYKPPPRFFGTGPVYIGLELEVEAPDRQAKENGLAVESNPNWCYAKRDGSLSSCGWELVTHPICLASWMTRTSVQNYRDYHNLTPGQILRVTYKGVPYTAEVCPDGTRVLWNGTIYGSISAAGKAIREGKSTNGYQFFGLIPRGATASRPDPVVAFFQLVARLKGMGYTSHDNGRCGFHMHVSRKAFSESGELRNPMFYRFKCLINGVLFRKLSQRTTFTYCQQEPVDLSNFTYQYSRHCAVNTTRETVEVRLFRGSLRETRLRKNLEAVIAALEFSREPSDYAAPSDDKFVAWCRQRRERFPNLVGYINTHVNQPPTPSAPPATPTNSEPDQIELSDETIPL